MGIDSATLGNAIHLKRTPKCFHWPNDSIKIRSVLNSARNVDEPYPFIVTDEYVVGMAFRLLHGTLERRTIAVTGRRRKIVHLKMADFAAPVHGFVLPRFCAAVDDQMM